MKNRIDKELVERQLITSRTRAQELIESGYVKCNNNVIYKCNYLASESDKLEIIKNDKLKFVSRGGLKLGKAINEFGIDLKNKVIMDIGLVLVVFVIVLYKMVPKKLLQLMLEQI